MSLWESFWELSTERQSGMSVGPIPWSSIERYWQRNRGMGFSQFYAIMRSMDSAYLSPKPSEQKPFSRSSIKGK